MLSPVQRTLVDKERIRLNGKLYYRLYFFDHTEGVIQQVLSPVVSKEIILTNEGYEYAV